MKHLCAAVVFLFCQAMLCSAGPSDAGQPAAPTNAPDELSTFAAFVPELNTNLTAVGQSLNSTNDTTEIGADLDRLGGRLRQIATSTNFADRLAQYMVVTNTPCLSNDLGLLVVALAPFQKTPNTEDLRVISHILANVGNDLKRIKRDIDNKDTNSFPAHLDYLGSDLMILSIECSGPIVRRTERFTQADEYLAMRDSASNDWGQVSLWTGAKLLSPYTINTTTEQLQGSGTTTSGFIEIDFNERYVMRDGEKFDQWTWPWAKGEDREPDDGQVHCAWPWRDVFDLSGSFGYVFGNGTTASNFTASTIVGSSDIYGDISIGLPVLRYCSGDYSLKQQMTVEFNGGFTTDKQFDIVHPSFFGGIGYQGKFPNMFGTTNLPIYWFGRAGMARIDVPTIVSTNVVFANIGGLNEPQFHAKWAPSMGTTVIIPVNRAISLQFAGNAYFSTTPANWNITLGVTLDLSKFASGLGTALGLSQ